MITQRVLGLALVLAAFALPAHGQSGLEWRFKKGAKFFVETATTNAQVLGSAGNKQTNHNSTVTSVSSFEVLDLGSGGAVLRQRVEGVAVKTDDATAPGAARAAGALRGMQFRFTLSPTGKISGFEGYAEFLKKLAGGNEAAEQALRTAYPEASFVEELTAIFGFLPDQSPAMGATWKRKEGMTLGPLGRLSGETEYTYRGKGESGEQIGMARTLAYEAPKEAGNLKISNVKVQEARGNVVFDPGAGRLVRQDLTVKLQGTVTITDTGMKSTVVNVQQTTTRSIRLLDKNPLDGIETVPPERKPPQ